MYGSSKHSLAVVFSPGGTHVCVDDSQCSHIVVADGVQELPNELKNDSTTPKRPTVVKQEVKFHL